MTASKDSHWRDKSDPPDSDREVFVVVETVDGEIYDTDHYDKAVGWIFFSKEMLIWMDIPKHPEIKKITRQP